MTKSNISKTHPLANTPVADIVDELGVLKAQLAELALRESALKEALIAVGLDVANGKLFRATVSHSERSTLDMEAVRAKLTPQFIAAHTRITPVVTVRVVSRTQAAA